MRKTQIALIILLFLLCIGIGLFAYFTDGFDFSEGVPSHDSVSGTLTVSVNGQSLSPDSALHEESALRFDVNADEFTVEVLPGSATFDFRHNGALVKFPYIDGNFNDAFEVTVSDGYFTMNTANRSMESILEAFYPGEDVTDISALDETAAYFILRVSGNGETVEIPLTGFYEFIKIELDKTEIIF